VSIITLTTDFGTGDSYVAQMKGVILSINPAVQIVDVTHAVGPQDVSRAAAIVDEIAEMFPRGSIHVAVVDPGVGTGRALLAAQAADQCFLAPDNGLLTVLFRRRPPTRVHRLTDDRFWRKPVSSTFHGRDILGPVAAHLSLGTDLADFGPPDNVAELVQLSRDEPRRIGGKLIGRVESIDTFGNLISNIRESDIPPGDRPLSVFIGGCRIDGISRCYADWASGSVLALFGSSGRLEVAVPRGSAQKQLAVSEGAEVRIETTGGE
jgi:S-adenosylmethionine hydrolase